MMIPPRCAVISSALFLCLSLWSGTGQTLPTLESIESQYVAAFQVQVENGHVAKVAELEGKYLGALEKAMQAAGQRERLKEALALREEMTRVKEKGPLPETDEGVEPALAKLRGAYREQLGKLLAARTQAAGPVVKKFEEALAAHQAALTKAGQLDEAAAVLAYREAGVAAKLLGEGAVAASPKGARGAAPSKAGSGKSRDLAGATKEKPFENSLGMRFVPVPGTEVLFCIHETRWVDFEAFVKRNPEIGSAWRNQTFDGFKLAERAEEHPVVDVRWVNAQAFCQWLSEKERKTYRLPTDREWSLAVGLEEEWGKDVTPRSVEKNQEEYPWGKGWPPPAGAGNYSDQSRKAKAPTPATASYLEGYDDGFPTTAPVMSFAPNQFGLYDLGGNVWEWMEDKYAEDVEMRVVRGGGWYLGNAGDYLSSHRGSSEPVYLSKNVGFRCVVVAGAR